MDLFLGANVDPSGRLVDEEDLWILAKPTSHRDLLLVSAAQLRNRLGQAFHRHPDQLQEFGSQDPLSPAADDSSRGDFLVVWQHQILDDREIEDQTKVLPILWNERYTAVRRGRGTADLQRRAVDHD